MSAQSVSQSTEASLASRLAGGGRHAGPQLLLLPLLLLLLRTVLQILRRDARLSHALIGATLFGGSPQPHYPRAHRGLDGATDGGHVLEYAALQMSCLGVRGHAATATLTA